MLWLLESQHQFKLERTPITGFAHCIIVKLILVVPAALHLWVTTKFSGKFSSFRFGLKIKLEPSYELNVIYCNIFHNGRWRVVDHFYFKFISFPLLRLFKHICRSQLSLTKIEIKSSPFHNHVRWRTQKLSTAQFQIKRLWPWCCLLPPHSECWQLLPLHNIVYIDLM